MFGIVGDPIAQVRSPEMITWEFHRRGVDALLVPIHVPAVTLTPIPYRSKVGFSGSLSADAAGRGPLHRANSKGVFQSSALWGRLSL
jgi:hypothetical protein